MKASVVFQKRIAKMPRYSKNIYSIMPYIEKARLRYDTKVRFSDGSIAVGVDWELPQRTTERPHGYKYRLNYSTFEGKTIVRFDNKTGKGDHLHGYDKEFPYTFQSIDVLIADFWSAIAKCRKENEDEEKSTD